MHGSYLFNRFVFSNRSYIEWNPGRRYLHWSLSQYRHFSTLAEKHILGDDLGLYAVLTTTQL